MGFVKSQSFWDGTKFWPLSGSLAERFPSNFTRFSKDFFRWQCLKRLPAMSPAPLVAALQAWVWETIEIAGWCSHWVNIWTSTPWGKLVFIYQIRYNQFSDFGMTWNTNFCSWLSGYRKFILDDLGGQNPGGCEHLHLWRCSSPQSSYRQLVWTHPVLKPLNHGPVANHSGSFLFFNHKSSR